jgi:hypothetical protein
MTKTLPAPFIEDAEKYDYDRVVELYVEPPEGQPLLTKNAVVVGQRGVGKTMLLKKLYSELGKTGQFWPVYVELEKWTSRISLEGVPSIRGTLSPRDLALRAAADMAVSLRLIRTVVERHGEHHLNRCKELFPLALREKMASRGWYDALVDEIRTACAGGLFSVPPEQLPRLTDVANELGDAAREHNATLVILIDQADKVPELIAVEVAKLLSKGGSYLAVLATRPYPTAPNPWMLPPTISAGDDFELFTLGREPRTEAWQKFLIQVLRGRLPKEVVGVMEQRQDDLSCLVGGSVRSALMVGKRLELIGVRTGDDSGWSDAVQITGRQEITLARQAISAYCGSIPKFLNDLRGMASSAMKLSPTGVAPTVISFASSPGQRSLFARLTEAAEALVRVACKAGIFWPTEDMEWVPDIVLDQYYVSPLILLDDKTLFKRNFDVRRQVFDVPPEVVAKWTEEPPRRRQAATRTRAFVSHWMGESVKKKLPDILRERIGTELDVAVGGADRSASWLNGIVERIRQSHLVIADVSVDRRDVYSEIGVAAAAERPTLLAVRELRDRKKVASWLQHRQIWPFGTDDEMIEFLDQLRSVANAAIPRHERWIETPEGDDLRAVMEPNNITIIGRESFIEHSLAGRVSPVLREHGMSVTQVVCQDFDSSDKLYETLRAARGAGTLVLEFSARSQGDLVSFAGGVLMAKQKARIGGTNFLRKVIASGRRQTMPGLILKLSGTRVASRDEVQDAILQRAEDYRAFQERSRAAK